jgi:hypothetical protein
LGNHEQFGRGNQVSQSRNLGFDLGTGISFVATAFLFAEESRRSLNKQ